MLYYTLTFKCLQKDDALYVFIKEIEIANIDLDNK